MDGGTQNTHADTFGDFQNHFLIIDQLVDGAKNTAARDDLIATTQSAQHFLVLLSPLLLRTDQQEIEHDKDQDERQEGLQLAAGSSQGRGCLGERGRNEHGVSPLKLIRS